MANYDPSAYVSFNYGSFDVLSSIVVPSFMFIEAEPSDRFVRR